VRGRVAVLTALLALVVVASAQADSRTISDRRGDTKGSHWPGPGYVWATEGQCAGFWMNTSTGSCSGEGDYFENAGPRLDITSVFRGHRGRSLVHRLSTSRRWANTILSGSTGGQISFYFDTDSDAAVERRVDVVLVRGKLKVRNAGRAATARRPNRRTVEVAFPRSLLRGQHVEWFAFAGIQCRRNYDLCGDRTRLAAHHLG
jgi:hypothetical protein